MTENMVANPPQPHSRACGFRTHPHGPLCSPDCPTCHGMSFRTHPPQPSPEPLLAALQWFEEHNMDRPVYLPSGTLIHEWNQKAGEPVRIHNTMPVFTCTTCWCLVSAEAMGLHAKTHEEKK